MASGKWAAFAAEATMCGNCWIDAEQEPPIQPEGSRQPAPMSVGPETRADRASNPRKAETPLAQARDARPRRLLAIFSR